MLGRPRARGGPRIRINRGVSYTSGRFSGKDGSREEEDGPRGRLLHSGELIRSMIRRNGVAP